MKRAAVDPATLAVLAVAGLILVMVAPSSSEPGRKHFWEFWKKNPVEQVNRAAAAVDQAKRDAEAAAAAAKAKVDAEREKQLHVGQDAAIATGAAIDAAQSATAAGKFPVRELETAKSVNATNVHAMEQALGAAAPARVRELEQMVADLNAGVVAGRKALELMQGTLDKTVAEKAEALAELEKVKAAGAIKVAALEAARDAAIKKEQAWALERDGIARAYERLTFWGKLGAAAFGLVALYVVFLLVRTRTLGNFGKDAVGLVEYLKGELQSRATAEDFAAIKDTIGRDWMTAHDGTAAIVAKIKRELRL